jgi:hypothetical protein
LQGAEAAVQADDDGEEAGYIAHEGDGKHEVERRKYKREGAERGVALGDAGSDEGALQKEGERHGNEQRAATDDGEGEAKKMNKGFGEIELGCDHGSFPAVVRQVTGLREGLRHEDVGTVISDTHGRVGAADEFAKEHCQGAEQSEDRKPANELQLAS